MRSLNKPNISFIVRIWWEEEEADARDRHFWRGWVQHVRSGEVTYVQDVEQLLNFIERWTGSLRKSESELKAKENHG